jgi:galactokinase
MSATIAVRLLEFGMSESEALTKAARFEKLDQHLVTPTGLAPLQWFVPGRIEVLGKHTDYAGGRSLLCTAERGFCVAAVERADSTVRIYDIVRQEIFEFAVSSELEMPARGWQVYAAAVARRLARNFPGAMRGANIALASDLPSAAGMSSSSALVVAIFAVLCAVNHLTERPEYVEDIHTPEDLAGYLGCVENGQTYKSLAGDGGVGTFGGSEDHTAILNSQPAHLSQYSFCPVRLECTIALPADCTFVIAASGVVANKLGGARARYNRASLAAGRILGIWQSTSGTDDLTLAAVATRSQDSLDRLRTALRHESSAESTWLLDRFEQFRLESEILIPQASDALARHDLTGFGELVDESQTAAEQLLGNQVPATIWLAQRARSLGAYAASAFGAGFGGSVWALVDRHEAGQFANRWRKAYQNTSHTASRDSEFFVTAAGPPTINI